MPDRGFSASAVGANVATRTAALCLGPETGGWFEKAKSGGAGASADTH